jgi:hypothetical protein
VVAPKQVVTHGNRRVECAGRRKEDDDESQARHDEPVKPVTSPRQIPKADVERTVLL